ncbi:1-deoxy-D-xylulose-5-phosphate synthase [Aquimarina sp. ERC-38]|uniref:1-deoxy-D-xylulose-5-phosphate synthase n=1 Tax=Aquimarina sp. ERC-38 TaxID=2949996 RepID=UPI002245DF29|nr:1-deoxy-D-xylulose-5-phosphate synthase [Aquimarina sp. ERC-38]UZO81638.1 1-deoxy-D-xylulose-5-phosphate synthase [Aquimarina sp. ERC-38]
MNHELLAQINNPEDLKKLKPSQLPLLVSELRDFIIHMLAVKEGHLGASLGVVELTVAVHYIFNTPDDLLVWDVGHQAYAHKILTGRRKQFHTNRQLNGLSGFPKISESKYDSFGTGHSSTSISAVLGMAVASKIKKDFKKQHIAVIGDASIASGMAFEAMNHAGISGTNILIILNDNDIGIDPSVGALKLHFKDLKNRSDNNSISIFEAFNFAYYGPIDGHDLSLLLNQLEELKNTLGPRILHIKTIKGKGLQKAEENQVQYHAPGKFDATTGNVLPSNITNEQPPKFQDVFGLTLVEIARKNSKIVGITPAMPSGSSLHYMMKEFPDRTFDVGIAEQHAVTFAAGLATQGFIPFCVIYSTFLQRAYDQVIHDVALQKLPVIFCIDRAGLVGQDGATHHGVFDIAFLRCIPNLILLAPKDEIELRNILYTVSLGIEGPVAIRYPRGKGTLVNWRMPFEKIDFFKAARLTENNCKIAVLSTGTIATNVTEAIHQTGPIADHYHFTCIKPLDEPSLHQIFKKYETIIIIEDGVVTGGFGFGILEFANFHKYSKKIHIMGVPDQFINQGTVEELQELCGISVGGICGVLDTVHLQNISSTEN